MRLTGTLELDGSYILLDQGGNYTKILSNAPSGDITITMPSVSATLVGRATTDTLTNKTLTTPTLTLPVIGDTSDATKALAFTLSGATTGKTLTLISAHTNNRSITYPDATTTLVGTDTTQTLTNKTLTSPTLTTPALGTPSALVLTNATGLPLSSGVTGQLPIANGGTGQATAAAGFNALSPNTNKGDIAVHTGVTNARLAVGNDGEVLSADSGQTSGLRWIPILSNPMDSEGDLIVGGASGAATKLDAGTANYMLMANGAAAPSWSLIANANVSGTAAIAYSKLNLATSILNADINASAAIAYSKLAALTASRALVSDGSGVVSAASVTATELGYLSGVTAPTGSGALVLASSPTLVTPVLGVASATSINKVAITAPATSATLTLADGTVVAGPAASGTLMTLSNVETVSGAKTFNDGKLLLAGSSSGAGTLKAPAAASTYVWTLPAATVTLASLSNTLGDFAATTSAQLASVVSDETGSGALVFGTSPTLVTPTLGVASATSINKVAITAPATSATLTIADDKTLTVSNTLTLTGTDTSSVAFGGGGTVAYVANKLNVFASTSSSELAGVISDETGSGVLVFGTAPTLKNPVIGDTADATKAIAFTLSGATAAKTLTVVSSHTDNRTLTLADGNMTVGGNTNNNDIVTKAGTQTLTNKTLTSPTFTAPVLGVATGTSLELSAGVNVGGATASANVPLQVAGVSTASNLFAALIWSQDNTAGREVIKLSKKNNSTSEYYIRCYKNAATYDAAGTGIGRIEDLADTFTLTTESDIRLKTNIQLNSEHVLDRLNQLQVVDFEFLARPGHTVRMGMIAQQVNEIFPDMVSKPDDGQGPLDAEGNNTWAIGSSWHNVFIKAFQELSQQNAELAARIAQLENPS